MTELNTKESEAQTEEILETLDPGPYIPWHT